MLYKTLCSVVVCGSLLAQKQQNRGLVNLFCRVVSEALALALLYKQQLQQKLKISPLTKQAKRRHHIKEKSTKENVTIPLLSSQLLH